MKYVPNFLKAQNFSQEELYNYVEEGILRSDCLEIIQCASLELQAHMRPTKKISKA